MEILRDIVTTENRITRLKPKTIAGVRARLCKSVLRVAVAILDDPQRGVVDEMRDEGMPAGLDAVDDPRRQPAAGEKAAVRRQWWRDLAVLSSVEIQWRDSSEDTLAGARVLLGVAAYAFT
jgi:hypothetical protein